ncbi:hypothetical protein [Streptomyces cavernicola]|uniref:Uncharacterized protein n=1 Tax=Streptomyces cavernicola TaxID=3043613 RepID=A0ABT6SB30_9ACTN|nr:hypothetical protein [Streptomyces sp. B-S-A6]MDI3405408.1 hypothetical protein [Streptomyces sp. B-S-A6]
MKFIKIAWRPEFSGFHLDPTAYLDELPGLQATLPPGAWNFASEADHYSMRAPRCVKDLELSNISVPVRKEGRLSLGFSANPWKHESGLNIEYFQVSRFSVESDHEIDWMQGDTVLLDEILPFSGGCRHEIALTDSLIIVECEDLVATWGDV